MSCDIVKAMSIEWQVIRLEEVYKKKKHIYFSYCINHSGTNIIEISQYICRHVGAKVLTYKLTQQD